MQTIDGTKRFRTVRALGEGSTGAVFEVEDAVHGGRFALKRLHPHLFTAESISRFKDEFRALQRICHQNLVAVHEVLSDGAGLYLVMDLVTDATSFVGYVRPREDDESGSPPLKTDSRSGPRRADPLGGTLSIERLHAALPQLVAGLSALHAAGRIHADINPDNVLVTRDGHVTIIDFGLVTHRAQALRALRGTPLFMAPERLRGAITEASDWYAIGVLLYGCLAGRWPAAGASLDAWDQPPPRPVDPRIHHPDLPNHLVELTLDLLQHDPKDRPSGDEIAKVVGLPRAPGSGRVETYFVGRTGELERLRDACARVEAGEQLSVHVRGESGIGKTALLEQFGRWAAERGAIVLRGDCYVDASLPYKGLDGVIDRLAVTANQSQLPLAAELRDALSVLFPVFGRKDAAASDAEPALLRRRAVAAIRDLLGQLTARAPVVVCIEDLHWADPDSVELLLDVFYPKDLPRLLLVLGYRLSRGAAAPYVRDRIGCDDDIELGPLDGPVLRSLVERAGRGAEEHADVVVRDSGGNPYFAWELLRALLGGYSKGELSLGAVLDARLARLSAQERTYVELVSVATRPIEEEVLSSALRCSWASERAARRSLVAEFFVRPVEGESSAVEPYHDRIRAHVVGKLPDEVRRGRHRSLADAYEALGRGDAETLGAHYRAAGDWDRALPWIEKAGDAAALVLAFEHAAKLYASILELAGEDARPRILQKLAAALSDAGRPADAARAFEECLARSPGDADLMLATGDEYLRAGEIERGVALLRDLAITAGEPIPKRSAAVVAGLLWNAWKLRRVAVRGWIAESDASPESRRRLMLCLIIARRLVMADFRLAALFQLRHLLLALATGTRADIVQGLSLQACFAAQMPAFVGGGPDRAEQMLRTATELVRADDAPLTRACVLFAPGAIALAKGRWRETRGALEAVISLLQEKTTVGLRWDVAFSQGVITQMLCMEGSLVELRARMRAYLREAQGHRTAEAIHVLRGSVTLALCDDRPDEARRLASEAIAKWPAEPRRIPHYFHAAAECEIDLYAGAHAAAEACLAECTRTMRESGAHEVSLYAASDLVLRARTALALRSGAKAEAAVRRLLGRPEGWAAAIGRALHACAAAQRGDGAAAAAGFERAIRELETWDLGLYADAARWSLARCRGAAAGEREALGAIERRGIRRPERFAHALLPS